MKTKKLINGRYAFGEGDPPGNLTETQLKARRDFINEIHRKSGYEDLKACPYCGSKDFTVVSEVDSRNIPAEIAVCSACDGCFKSRILTPESNRYYYERISYILRGKDPSEESREKLFKERVNLQAYPRYRFIRALTGIKEGQNVLEIGCGDGANLIPWKENGFEVHGIEIDPNTAAFAGRKGLNVIQGDFMARNIEEIKPGLVIVSHALEHVSDANAALAKLSLVAKDGGYLFIEVPGVRRQAIGIPMNHFDVEHNYYFELKTLKMMLKRHSLGIVYGDEYIRAICAANGNNKGRPETEVPVPLRALLTKKMIEAAGIDRLKLADLFDKGERNALRIRILNRSGAVESYFKAIYDEIENGADK